MVLTLVLSAVVKDDVEKFWLKSWMLFEIQVIYNAYEEFITNEKKLLDIVL